VGYHFVARKDRSNNHYGGVIIAAKDNLVGTELKLDSSAEFCAARFDCPGKKSLIIGSLYRPPSRDYLYIEELTKAISKLHQCNPESTLAMTTYPT